MIITKPDPYLLPSYRLSPFNTTDVRKNARISATEALTAEHYLDMRFAERNYYYTQNGRAAINAALSFYQLKAEDVVTILTTTDNFYISGCVTREIEKFCSWSRKIEVNTKLLFVNHEFGFPRENMENLKAMGYPIIEDCAYSFFSQSEVGNTGAVGDFTIYSFPKMFPIQIGGLLTWKRELNFQPPSKLQTEEENYIKKVIGFYIKTKDALIEKRRNNHKIFENALQRVGCHPRLDMHEGIVPGVFLFTVPTLGSEMLPKLKERLWSYGIHCSVFYGENAFYLPLNQRLEEEDIYYITEVTISLIRALS